MDNIIFIRNVGNFIKSNNMTIGKFEQDIGVSKGYLSRLKKNPIIIPPADILVKVSRVMDISIDTLLMINLERNVNTVYNMINKLKDLTMSKDIKWSIVDDYSDKFDFNSMIRTNYKGISLAIVSILKVTKDKQYRNYSPITYDLISLNNDESSYESLTGSNEMFSIQLHDIVVAAEYINNDITISDNAASIITTILSQE